MSIGFSDGSMAEDWGQYYTSGKKVASLGLDPSESEVELGSPMTDEDDSKQEQHDGNEDFQKWQEQKKHSKEEYDPTNTKSLLEKGWDWIPSGKGNYWTDEPGSRIKFTDTSHRVPLIASALTKDGSTMHGMAVDHRVNLAMNFEGKDHDITPFLWAHEQAELGPMAAAVKGGMDAKDAYELAHDKVANPAEAAVRNSYAITHGLDVDKFNEAYWSHINTQKEIAAQTSGQGKHPDAHTTIYGLDPLDKTPEEEDQMIHQYEDDFSPRSSLKDKTHLTMDMEDTPGYLLRHGGQNDFGGMGSSARQGPMIQPKPANDNKDLEIRTQEREAFDAKFEQLRDRLLGPKIRGTIPKEVMTSLKGLDHLGFDRPTDALNAIRDDIKRGADPKKNWDIHPEDELMWKRVMDYIDKNP